MLNLIWGPSYITMLLRFYIFNQPFVLSLEHTGLKGVRTPYTFWSETLPKVLVLVFIRCFFIDLGGQHCKQEMTRLPRKGI